MLVVLLGLQSLALFGGIIPSVNQVYVKPVCYYFFFLLYELHSSVYSVRFVRFIRKLLELYVYRRL